MYAFGSGKAPHWLVMHLNYDRFVIMETRIAPRRPNRRWLLGAVGWNFIIMATDARVPDPVALVCQSVALSVEPVTTGRAEVTVSSNTSSTEGMTVGLQFAAGDDFSEVSYRIGTGADNGFDLKGYKLPLRLQCMLKSAMLECM
jgi:hypothetical protein